MALSEFDQFEQKKVQEVKGSYYIYLPKSWCKKYGVAEDKRIFLKQLADDSLLIRSNSKALEMETSYTIDLDIDMERPDDCSKEEYIDYLFNLYLTAYIIGYHTIILKKRTKIPLKVKNRIHKMTRKLYGMVVISESETQIVVEEHLDEIDLRVMSKQLLNKVGLLMGNFVEMVEEDSIIEEVEDMVDELIEQDNQIDEHRYAIERYVHQILTYPTLGRFINVSSVECLHYSENTRLIERIGDHITKLAKLLKMQPIEDRPFVLKHLHGMVQYYHTIQDYYWRKDSLKFFSLTRDIKEYSIEIKQLIFENHPDTEYLIPIRRVCNICGDIAEIRINDILARQQAAESDNHHKTKKTE
ncbi:PhoU domain-containing protein [Candidatus Lokiarchaeum ossiferum]|uniref:PhoU domain-containing protein n=1 Tax=Candidatus Lokiarchaeum ossiferum TaxID=2951803 RepID=UPI00352D72EF